MTDVFEQFPTLRRAAGQVVTADELSRKLASGRPLRRWFRIVSGS